MPWAVPMLRCCGPAILRPPRRMVRPAFHGWSLRRLFRAVGGIIVNLLGQVPGSAEQAAIQQGLHPLRPEAFRRPQAVVYQIAANFPAATSQALLRPSWRRLDAEERLPALIPASPCLSQQQSLSGWGARVAR